jgi:hypothetical protein
MKQSKYSVARRNERINGKKNAESLKFMEYVKSTPTDELARQLQSFFEHWQRAAITREIERRNKKNSEGQST